MKRGRYVLCAILLLATGIRVGHLRHFFWIDESFSAALATQDFKTIARLSAKDVHPPLYFWTLRLWNLAGLQLFGTSPAATTIHLIDYRLGTRSAPAEFVVSEQGREPAALADGIHPALWERYMLAPLWFLRLLNVLGALISIWLLWILATRLYPDKPGIAVYGCLIFACSGFAIFWDTVIRSYSFVAIFILALHLVWPLMPGSLLGRILFSTALAILLLLSYMTSYIALFFLPAYGVMMVLQATPGRRWAWYVAPILLSVVLFILVWGSRMAHQLGLGPSAGALSLTSFLPELLHNAAVCISLFWPLLFSYAPWMVLNASTSPILYHVVFLLFSITIGFGIWRYRRGLSTSDGLVLSSILVPFLVPTVVDALRPGLLPLEARYFYPILPFFALFLAAGLLEIKAAILNRMVKETHRKKST